jgi:serine/threonine protein kinase
MSFSVGENVGPYRIVEQLGQGGMATVYKAYHASLDRYVALKALHPAFNEDKGFASRFQREARVVAKLEHPNIVPIYDYAEHEGRPYLVMKYIEGDTLKARLNQGPLSSEEINQIVDSVGSALAYAHKQGVLHRDIKPSNVLVATDGQMYLADFGLARIAQSGESTLSSDMIMGTPQYISPEQAMGKKDLDARTDLYSFGVMLYEMVVGQVPFNADTPFSVIHDHIYTPLPLPHKVNPNVPESVERVLLKSLAKEREDRYEDVTTLVHAFKDAWAEAGVPMQGTFVRLSQALKPAITKTPPSAEPAKTVAAAQPTIETAEPKAAPVTGTIKTVSTAATSEPVKKRSTSTWLWISAGLVIILCLGFLGFARSNRLLGRLLTGGGVNKTPATATQPQPLINLPRGTAQPTQPPPLATTVGGVLVPPQVADAQKRANEHPNDLDVQLDLALTYWNASWQKETYETLGNVVKLAGMDNRDYFMRAGDKFRSQNEGWMPAAVLYFQAFRSYSLSGDVPNHVTEAFHEALYKGAVRPEFPSVLPLDQVTQLGGPISLIAQSRHAFFAGKKNVALDLLNQAKRIEDTMREAFLLEGEFAIKDGNPDKAKLILNPLVDDTTSSPEWIRLFAKFLLDGIK